MDGEQRSEQRGIQVQTTSKWRACARMHIHTYTEHSVRKQRVTEISEIKGSLSNCTQMSLS